MIYQKNTIFSLADKSYFHMMLPGTVRYYFDLSERKVLTLQKRYSLMDGGFPLLGQMTVPQKRKLLGILPTKDATCGWYAFGISTTTQFR